MATFSINSGGTTTFTDTTPASGIVIDFASLDNSFGVQINGVDLFVGGPGGVPNELEFQNPSTSGQTVRFADGTQYGSGIPEIWQLSGTTANPIVRLEINPDGTIALSGVKTNGAPLEPLQLFNGMTVNTAAIDAAWNDSGSNTIVVSQFVTGPTNASGAIEDVICFSSDTLIKTPRGAVCVKDLRIGDSVLTYDHGYQPIQWIGSCRLSDTQLDAQPNLKPIRICAGALGPGFPAQDLIVSPQHRVLVSSAIAKRMFDVEQVLISAKKLLPIDGVDVVQDYSDGIEYWHILFHSHEIVWANGMPAETLFVGPEALKAVSSESRAEIEAMFPEICEIDFQPSAVRYIPEKGRLAKKLVQRHFANGKPLYGAAV